MQVNYIPKRNPSNCEPMPLVVHVVIPPSEFGRSAIKDVSLEVNRSSPLLTIRHIVGGSDGKKVVGISDVFLQPNIAQAGCLLLKEEYEKAGWPEGYDVYCQRQEQARMLAPEERAKLPPVEPYLPPSVRALLSKRPSAKDVSLPAPPSWGEDDDAKPKKAAK